MSDLVEDVGISDVEVKLEDDEDPETALRDVKMRLDELYGALDDLEDGHPQRGPVRLEVRVLEQVRDELEAMI